MALTKQQQKKRSATLEKCIDELQHFNELGLNKSATIRMKAAFVVGFSTALMIAEGKDSIDPIYYFAILRGGDPTTELTQSLARIKS
jgi:hypothetical protein